MVQLTFWTVLTLCLSIYRAANGGEDAKHAWTKTMPFSFPIENVISQSKTCCERICIEFTALCSKKDNSPYIGSVSYVCETTDPVSHPDKAQTKNAIYLCKDEKHSCDMICTKSGLSVPCLNITFDDHCDTSTMDANMCREEDCRNCLDVICNMTRMPPPPPPPPPPPQPPPPTTRTTTTTQSTVNSSDSSTSRMTEMDSKSTTVMNSTTSSNSMTSTKGTEPATAFSPELSTEGAATSESNSEPLSSSSSAASEASPSYSANGSNLMTQPSAALMSSTFSSNGVVVVSVIGVLVILIIAVVLIVIFCRRYRGGRVSFDDRLRGVDIIEATNGQRNPAYSLVQGIPTADDSSHHPQSMNIYSESPTQNPSTTNNDEDDTILVDNDLYGHQQPEQNFPNQTVLSAKENAIVDNQPQRDSAYSLVQSVSTTDASFQPPVDSTPSGQKPSPDGNQDTILVENDLYGCQQAPKSTYETALRVSDNDAVDNVQTSSSLYSLVQRVSTADDPSEPQAANTCSESSSPQRPPSADNNDRILVDNDLYNC